MKPFAALIDQLATEKHFTLEQSQSKGRKTVWVQADDKFVRELELKMVDRGGYYSAEIQCCVVALLDPQRGVPPPIQDDLRRHGKDLLKLLGWSPQGARDARGIFKSFSATSHLMTLCAMPLLIESFGNGEEFFKMFTDEAAQSIAGERWLTRFVETYVFLPPMSSPPDVWLDWLRADQALEASLYMAVKHWVGWFATGQLSPRTAFDLTASELEQNRLRYHARREQLLSQFRISFTSASFK
jgi:hypothetical protein